MKTTKLVATLIAAAALAAVSPLRAEDAATNGPAQPAPYPLTTCPVSGEKLGGDMGAPYVFVYQGQEVKLCCSGCKKDFLKDPAKYLKKINDAAAAAKK